MVCDFCYRHCNLTEGEVGFCRVRKVHNNKIESMNYGFLESIAIDPVEKKPLYHFLPGSKTLSVAESGCNYRCDFCQNWQLSQRGKSTSTFVKPEKLVELALKYEVPSISFTYSEPIVWQDYVIDTCKIAKENGIKTIMVTNGSFSEESRRVIYPLIDAFNIDLKGDENYYNRVCKGNIYPVLDAIEYMVEKGCHVEVTTLLIEGIHTAEVVRQLGREIYKRGVEVWHLSRFFPEYKMSNRAATSEIFLSEMMDVAKEIGISYVYGGNTSRVDSTLCCQCKNILITNHRDSNIIVKDCTKNIIKGHCANCDHKIYGVFE